MQELSNKEIKWYGVTFFVVLILMCGFALSGCATSKPLIQEHICPPTYLERYNASEQASDRLEDELSRARADSNAYMVAHRRCMAKFDSNLSKSR
ncbi:MAG: hypothetical protein KAS32_21135 [Candidatus Peribacteraceae bacterium]|nr:hypothetical protein [Candidatus Peribacteraceae bacterium]